jgi:hypothetical protein
MVKTYLNSLNLLTFAIGLSMLIYGAVAYRLPDWDIGVSLLMATLTYLSAPWVISVISKIRYISTSKLLLAIFFTWLSVDGCYWAYWTIVDTNALVMREHQYLTSLCLYLMCGMFWHYAPTFTGSRLQRN